MCCLVRICLTVIYEAAIVGSAGVVVAALEVDHGHDGEVEVDAQHVVEGEPEEAEQGHDVANGNEARLLILI